MAERARLISLEDATVVELDVVRDERPEYNTTVTDYPVEEGASVSDHITLQPISATLTGVVAGAGATDKIATLKRFRNDRHRLRYVGRNILTNFVISEFLTEHDVSVGDGFGFRLGLQQVRVARPSMVEIIVPDPIFPDEEGTPSQVKDTDNAGRQQPVNSGHPALRLREDWETVMSYEEAVAYAERYGGGEILEGYQDTPTDKLQYVPLDKHRVPYSADIRIQGESFKFTFHYNKVGDFFTIDLQRDGNYLAQGEMVVYNRPLFYSYANHLFPVMAIVPFGVSGQHTRVGWEEMGNDVYLYLMNPRDL